MDTGSSPLDEGGHLPRVDSGRGSRHPQALRQRTTFHGGQRGWGSRRVAAGPLLAAALTLALLRGESEGSTTGTGVPRAAAPPAPVSLSRVAFSTIGATVPSAEAPNGPQAAAVLRNAVDGALSQRIVLTDRLVRARVRGDAEFAATTAGALVGNTDALRRTVTGGLDPGASASFTDLWTSAVASAARYARAVAGRDVADARTARTELDRQDGELARLLSRSTAGQVDRAEAQRYLATYTKALVAQADAYARAEYAKAYATEHAAYASTFDFGRALAAGIASARRFDGAVSSPVLDVMSRFQLLLGEHATLMEDVLRAGLAGSPDFASAAAALNENSRRLERAVAGSLGTDAGNTFGELWAAQINAVIGYAHATASGDRTPKRNDLEALDASAVRLSALLGSASHGKIPAVDVTALLQSHVRLLVQQIEDRAAQNYIGARDESVRDYLQVLDLARPISEGIIAAVARKAPRGGAQTGWGGALPRSGRI